MKKFDKYDTYSLVIFIVSCIGCWLVVQRLLANTKQSDDTVILMVNGISSVFSISGLIIAILQIVKVSSNTSVYKIAFDNAIETVTNNECISLLSRSLQQLATIKTLFANKSEILTRTYFDTLAIDLTFVSSNKNIKIEDRERLKEFAEYCKEMDTIIYKFDKKTTKNIDFSLKYNQLSEIQTSLTSIQQKLGSPKQK